MKDFVALEAAKYLKIRYEALMVLAKHNVIPYYKVGRSYVFKKNDLDMFIENKKHKLNQELIAIK